MGNGEWVMGNRELGIGNWEFRNNLKTDAPYNIVKV
jgi:hypothetical protein